MKKIGKGCLGCLGGLFLVTLIAVIGIGVLASRSSKSTAEEYTSYTLVDATYQVPSSWKVEENEKQQIFYLDKDSALYVGYTSGLNMLDETQRAGFVEGLNQSGTVSDETKYTANGKEGYTYSVIVTNDDGKEFPGKLFTLNAPQGAISFLYASVSDKSDDYLKIVEKIVSQVEFSETTTSSQAASSSDMAASSSDETSGSFAPTDTSDETIRSIKTYGDYLDMYEYLMTDYITYYQSKLDAIGLSDATMQSEFEQEKASLQSEFDAAKKQYGMLRNIPLPGALSNTFAEMLIQQRDILRASVDAAFAVYGQ